MDASKPVPIQHVKCVFRTRIGSFAQECIGYILILNIARPGIPAWAKVREGVNVWG